MTQTTEQKKQARKWWLYIPLFVLLGFIIVSALVLGTAYDTFNQIWQEEGRAYDTKWEHFVSTFAGGKYNRLIRSGHDPDALYMQLLRDTKIRAYKSAIQKIPRNDVEHLDWYVNTYFTPKANYLVVNDERMEEAERLLDIAIDVSSQLPELTSNSLITNDYAISHLSQVVSSFFFIYGKKVSPEKYNQHREGSLSLLHYGLQHLDSKKVLKYNYKTTRRLVYKLLTESYSIYRDQVFYLGVCDVEVAGWFLEVSDRIESELLRNAEEAKVYLVDEHVENLYSAFRNRYLNEDKPMRQRIARECFSNN